MLRSGRDTARLHRLHFFCILGFICILILFLRSTFCVPSPLGLILSLSLVHQPPGCLLCFPFSEVVSGSTGRLFFSSLHFPQIRGHTLQIINCLQKSKFWRIILGLQFFMCFFPAGVKHSHQKSLQAPSAYLKKI